jgi:hypothetical protein
VSPGSGREREPKDSFQDRWSHMGASYWSLELMKVPSENLWHTPFGWRYGNGKTANA